ncbi:hypothetical protein CsatB_023955 [Cannabis sativa]
MNLVAVAVGVAVGVAVVMAVVVVAVVGSIVDFRTVNKALLVRVLLRRETLGEKGVAMEDLVVISVMEKVVRENALAGHLSAVVELGEVVNLNVKKPSMRLRRTSGTRILKEKVVLLQMETRRPLLQEEKEHEDKEMTLEEYQKVLEEKRKALQTLKAEERKVDTKEFASMQQISSKKENQDIFIKLGSEKDKKKETAERDERAKKSVSINEFLKPAEGERYFTSGGRGRGRGRGGSRGGGFAGNYQSSNVSAPSIEDPGHFPTLGGK